MMFIKQTRMALIFCGILFVGGVFFLLIGLNGKLFSPCDDTIKSTIESPGGTYVVTLSERDCGATTDFSTIVSLRRASDSFKLNIDDAGTILILEGQYDVQLIWEHNENLLIMLPNNKRLPPRSIFKQRTLWNSVNVQYKRRGTDSDKIPNAT